MTIGDRTSGVVKWYREQKGYGFLKRDDGLGDVFVHNSGINDQVPLMEGAKVLFDVVKTDKGMKAVNVSVVG